MARIRNQYQENFLKLCYFLLSIYLIDVRAQHSMHQIKPWLQNGPPRFKQNQRVIHEVFLNDKAVFKCTALARPAPKIHWYRNGEYLNYTMMSGDRLRENKKHFSLEIKRVEVGDQGSWACKVWNQAGSIFRNFTLEIIDFCDYFLVHEYPPSKIPQRCICLWYLTGEYRREGINWEDVTAQDCEKYRKYASMMRKPLGKKICADGNCEGSITTSTFSSQIPSNEIKDIVYGTAEKDFLHGSDRMPSLFVHLNNKDSKEAASGGVGINALMQDQPRADSPTDLQKSHGVTLKSIEPSVTSPTTSSRPTTRLSFPPKKVAPYFKVRDEDAATSVITPSGRTIKLQCKAGGQPDPQVIWFNNKKNVITTEVRRPVGSEYRLRKNTLEIEDVAESDSGEYTCEAFNSAGSVTRTFKLRVVDRMRSKPIIVPNILTNKTVDANSTVNFTCKVISDLTPHIVWMKIELTNDSFYYWNETDRKYVFKYTDMQNMENAHITKTSQDSSTLTINNVTAADQGMYACISGNHLGHAIANATLIVNEFHAMTLATGDPESDWSLSSIIALCLLISLLAVMAIAIVFYIYRVRNLSKAQISQMGQYIPPMKKRVIVTKRPVDESSGWLEVPSTYQIHIEPVATSGHRRPRLSSDLTIFSDYEIPPDPAWEVSRSRLRFVNLLGEGAFGEVWRAMLKTENDSGKQNEDNEIPVAVKKLKSSAHEKELIDLVSEMETFKTIGGHDNLLRLIGCCTGTGPLYVILELCKHGNLRDFLRAHRPKDSECCSQAQDSPGLTSDQYLEPKKIELKTSSVENSSKDEVVLIKPLTQRHLVQFAWQIAKGMEFMASRKVIHRDLAARNVLVAEGFVMKISDFGLSRDVHYNDYYRKKGNGRLPIKWMALEALDSHVYTIYSDVWSFGILLWEIMTLGGTPYPSIAMQQLYSCLKEGYRMEPPDNCPEEIYDVMVACWQEKPENRPGFDVLVDYFDWMLTQTARDNENYLELQSPVSESGEEIMNFAPPPPLDSNSGLLKRRRLRPLSEPILPPKEPIENSAPDSEVENDTVPLLTESKSEAQPNEPNVYRSVRRRPGDSKSNQMNSSFYERRKLSSVANMSLDSAIGSPSWPFVTSSSVILDSPNSSERCYSSTDIVKRRIRDDDDSGHPSYTVEGSKESLADGEKKNCNDERYNTDNNRHYINIKNNNADKGHLMNSRFIFPPLRQSRFSDSSAYEHESIQLSTLNEPKAALRPSTSSNNPIADEKSTTNCLLREAKHRQRPSQRRYSIDSVSSGRGGSSGMSSAEGIGGISDFCKIEYTETLTPSTSFIPSPTISAFNPEDNSLCS